MSSVLDRIAALSPKQREMLERRLAQERVDPSKAPIIPRRREPGFFPLSFAQQRLWFLDQLEPGNSAYNNPVVMRLKGALHHEALALSLDAVVSRHEALRTTFETVDGRPAQIIRPHARVELPVTDLRELPAEAREREAARLAAEEAARPFDLSRGPLWRAALVRLADDDHVVLLTLHHIVSDAWSMNILVREVTTLYVGFVAGRPAPLAELPVQYADYAVWQRGWLQGEVLDAELDYWRSQLSGAPALLALPTDRPRPLVQGFRGGRHAVRLSPETTARLRALAQREGATLFVVLLAAFKALLHRYTGQTDIVTGTPVANRNRLELEGLIGFFLNMLALRVEVSGSITFRELVRRAQERMLSALAHQEVPFEKVVEAVDPERALSHTPLFQVVFTLQNSPGGERQQVGELQIEPIEVRSETAKFDLTLALEEVGGGVVAGLLEYNSDLFDEATVARMVRHFEHLAAAAAADPDTPVAALPMLTAEEQRQSLWGWQDEARPYPNGRCLHRLFESAAKKRPEAVAVVFGDEQVTYGELNRRANQLARHLRAQGVGPESVVGVLAERSAGMVVALLGVLKAGGAYLPLDPAYPAERLRFMVEDSGAGVVVAAEERLLGLVEGAGARSVCLELEGDEIAGRSASNLRGGASVDNLAYVIYTSGSTGRPKGVMVAHRQVARLLSATRRWFDFSAADAWTLFHSFAFDFSVWEMWGALAYGGRLVVVPYMVSRSPEEFRALLERERVTVLNQTPSAFRQLMRAEEAARSEGRGGLSLRAVVFGGEALEPLSLRPWFEGQEGREGGPRLVNMYGITETTVHVTYQPVRREQVEGGVGSLIGIPIPDLECFLLDARQQPVPLGVAGEIYVGGDGLARGYLGRAGLTAERFVPHPFSSRPGARLYKSGDLARRLADGSLEYAGRADEQVKIRGFRIELGEIEAALSQWPQTREAVVVARDDGRGAKRLVAYVALSEGATATVNDLRQHLQERLPDYMVPSSFVLLDELPLTANGKVNRNALPPPDEARPALGADYVAPRTEAERVLAAVWIEVLGVEQVGIHDNFFELGGDSILSIQIVARANQRGLRLKPRQVFEHQTVAKLAAVAAPAQPAQPAPGEVLGRVPLTPIQHWFFEQDLPDPHHFNQAMMLETAEPLDAGALSAAVRELLAHHDALRLRFARTESGWRQESVEGGWPGPFEHVDLSAVPPADQRGAVEARAAERQTSLNLAEGPLLRVTLFSLGAGRPSRLLIVIHHLVVDGVSWRILLDDLQVAYRQALRGEAAQLPPKTTSFQHWAGRLAEYANSEELAAEAPYWLGLSREAVAALPVDHAAGANTVASEQTVTSTLDAGDTDALLHKVPGVYRTNIDDLLLTALAQTLSRWTGARAVLVDMEGHGREELWDDIDLSRTVGWFTTIYPVLLEPGADAPPRDAIRSVKESLRRLPRRGLGYGLLRYLRDDARPGGGLRELPRAEVLFNYLGQLDRALAKSSPFTLAAASAGPTRDSRGARSHLLDVSGSVIGGRLQLSLTYSGNVHRRETIEALAADFTAALRSLVAHCLSPGAGGYTPSDFPLARLDQQALDRALAGVKEVEDLYPLAPTQQVMLSYALSAPGSEVGVEQMSCALHGNFDVEAFERAWRRVMERHPVLRTSFLWENLSEPLQAVHRRVALPLERHDWRQLPPAEQRTRLDAFLAEDRRRDFDFTRPPLMRAALIRLSEQEHYIVWSHHHVLLDGWCVARVLNEALALYGAFTRGREESLEPSRPYRDYIAWLGRQDLAEAEAFWRETLKGVSAPTALLTDRGAGASPGREGQYRERYAQIDADTAAALKALARQHQLTLNTVVQGCWALLLHHYSGADDVVFGVTVSGRPAELEGVESILGLFINILPMRLRVTPDEALAAWLRRTQERQTAMAQYEYSPLAKIQEWSEVPPRLRLFDTLLVFQNYPVGTPPPAADGARDAQELVMERIDSSIRTNYALTLVASPNQDALDLLLIYDARRFGEAAIDGMLAHLGRLLGAAAADPACRLSRLPAAPEAELTGDGHPDARLPAARPGGEPVAPRNAVELRAVQIWEEVLGVSPIGVTDNFFDLGGHSLSAIRVVGQMREVFGQELSLATLLQAGTVEQVARAITKHIISASGSPAVALQPHGPKRPFFIVHPSGGHVMCYVPLARDLDPERPVYGLRALDAEEVFDEGLEEMAARQVAFMREIQPRGPYLLGGWSFGAVLAYEMAQQLRREGERVASLCMIDITAPLPGLEDIILRLTGQGEGESIDVYSDDPLRLARLIGEMAGRAVPVDPDELKRLEGEEQLRHVLSRAQQAGIIPPEMSLADALRILRGYRCRRRAANRYEPEPYDGGVTVFFSDEVSAGEEAVRAEIYGPDPTRGWGKLSAEPPEIHVVRGTHDTIVFDPRASGLSEKLRECLDRAERDS